MWAGAEPKLGMKEWTPLMFASGASRYPPPPEPFFGDLFDKTEVKMVVRRIMKSNISESVVKAREQRAATICALLLAKGASIESADSYGATALFCSVQSDQFEVAKLLLHAGAKPNIQVASYTKGSPDRTPLHVCKSFRMAQLLLSYGANPEVKNEEGEAPSTIFSKESGRPFYLVRNNNGWQVRQSNTPTYWDE